MGSQNHLPKLDGTQMREHLAVRPRSRPIILGLFVVQAFLVSCSIGQSLPDHLADGFKYDTLSGFFVASFSAGDSTIQVAVFDKLVYGAVDYATSQANKVSNVERPGESQKDVFSDVPVLGTKVGSDGREYAYTVKAGDGVEIRVEDDALFVVQDILGQIIGLYESATGRAFDISSIGQNENGDINVRIESIVSNHALIVSCALVAFFVVIMILLVRLVQVRHENNLARRTWKKMIRAREDERKHLASELHDGPIQELQYYTRSMADNNGVEDDKTTSVIDDVTNTLRKICTDLRPEILAHFGLVSALQGLVEEFEVRHPNISTTIEVDSPTLTLGYENDLAYYRIVQESLHNIVKHADASEIAIDLSVDDKWAELKVQDNGKGFEMPRRIDKLVENGNLGLIGMMQRAQSIDAAFEVLSSEDGTTVRLVTKVDTGATMPAPAKQFEKIAVPVKQRR